MSQPRNPKLLGGPYNGREVRSVRSVATESLCTRFSGGPWSHHRRTTGGDFSYVGACDDVGCDAAATELCSQSWGISSNGWSAEHQCAKMGPHPTCICCCGAEKP